MTLAFSIFDSILNEVTRAQHVLLGAAAPRLAIAIELTTNDDDDESLSDSHVDMADGADHASYSTNRATTSHRSMSMSTTTSMSMTIMMT